MLELYKDIRDLIKNREYSKVFNTILAIFISIAPSASYMFMFKRDLFLTLDIFKLSILCVILNFMFIIFMFLVTVTSNSFKLILSLRQIDKQNYNDEENGKMLDEQRIKLLDKSAYDMVINILVFILMLWANYLFFHIYIIPGKPQESTLAMLFIIIIFIFSENIKIIKRSHNKKGRNQEKQIKEWYLLFWLNVNKHFNEYN